MKNTVCPSLDELSKEIDLPQGGRIKKRIISDSYGSAITILSVSNGLLTYTVLLDRGMDIGEVFHGQEKISWDRDSKYLLHPDNVDLSDNNGTGWLKGFYAAVASIGPELFGTPGEGYTLHGTGSYSQAAQDSVRVRYDGEAILVEGVVPVRGYSDSPVFEKQIRIKTAYGSAALLREDITTNLSNEARVLDDGFHIQLAGRYTFEGGRYVLPVATHKLLLRDSAPKEDDPLHIYPVDQGRRPIRCYQYVPEPVPGLDDIGEISPYLLSLQNEMGITAEMVMNDEKSTAAYVIRPLDCLPRSLIAKEIGENSAFCLEPCRARPNLMSQKIIDGEAYFLQPQASSTSVCLMGVTKDPETIASLEAAIVSASRG